MRKALLFIAILAAGCQGLAPKPVPIGSSNTTGSEGEKANLAENGGRWISTRKLIKTEWTFHPDGAYDALHQEGEVAAQIRGKYRWDNGFLVLDPNRDSIEARSRDKAEADRVQDQLSKGYELSVTWDGKETFTGTPKGGGEPLVFKRSQG